MTNLRLSSIAQKDSHKLLTGNAKCKNSCNVHKLEKKFQAPFTESEVKDDFGKF